MTRKIKINIVIIILVFTAIAFNIGKKYENHKLKTDIINQYVNVMFLKTYFLDSALSSWHNNNSSVSKEAINQRLSEIISVMTVDLSWTKEIFYPELINPMEPYGDLVKFFYDIYDFLNDEGTNSYRQDIFRKEYYYADGMFSEEEKLFISDVVHKVNEMAEHMNELNNKVYISGENITIKEFRDALWSPIMD